MSNNEKFCLRWNDFESNISLAFREIREEKDLFDCTLSCGSRQIQSHKLILSACSPFFRSILRQNPHQHPLLYLKGVEFTDLQAVLNFMYHGEVNVAQEELNSFLAVAEDLQVKGLTQTNSQPSTTKPRIEQSQHSSPQPTKIKVSTKKDVQPKVSHSKVTPPPPITRPVPDSGYQQQHDYDEDIQEVVPMVKTEPEQVSYQPVTQQHQHSNTSGTEVASLDDNNGAMVEDEYDYGGYEGVEQGYESQYQTGVMDQSKDLVTEYAEKTFNGKYSCNLCGFVSRDKYNIRIHIEGKHQLSSGYQCDQCYKYLRTKQSLSQHKAHCHVALY